MEDTIADAANEVENGNLLNETASRDAASKGDETEQAQSDVISKPFFDGLYDTNGTINKDALDRLPDYLKGSKELFSKYNTIEALMHGMSNLGKLAGKKGLEPLPEGAPEELVAEQKLLIKNLNKVPESIEGYGAKKPEEWPEGVPFDEEKLNKYLDLMHKHNASPELVNDLFKFNNEEILNAYKEQGANQETNLQQEKKKLQEALGDNYKSSMRLATRAVDTLGLDKSDPIFSTATGVLLAAKLGEAMREDQLVSGSSAEPHGMTDREKSLDIINNKANPLYEAYWNDQHPLHQKALEVRRNLIASHLKNQ